MSDEIKFTEFQKIARLSREVCITEKIDGTNASVYIGENGEFLTGSRNRWITPQDDNNGFSKWAYQNKEELLKLGVGHHFGEWWGSGIQRRYALQPHEKRFSLFNVNRWSDDAARPLCCHVVPILYQGGFDTTIIENILKKLECGGSVASPGFMNPEGIVIWHTAARMLFKKTIHKDEEPKSKNKG